VLLKVLWVSSVFGQYVNVVATRQTCTPLGCTVSDCMGSGVSVGTDATGRAVVLTAGHCLAGGAQRYKVGADAWYPASNQGFEWSQRDGSRADVGILTLAQPLAYCVPIAESAPQPGSDVTMHSYRAGDGRQFRVRHARVLTSDAESFTLSIESEDGDSGGAVMQNGALVGLISNTGFNPITRKHLPPTTATSAPAIRRFVIGKLGRLPHCGKPAAPAPPAAQDEAPPPPEVPGAEPKPGPISTPQCNCKALESKVSALNTENAALKAQLQAMKDTPPPEPKPEKRVLYFTSIGNPNTAETDKAARKLKDNGYPITIITLDPTETNVRDVPRAFELPSGKSVTGVSNVITYFATLSKGV